MTLANYFTIMHKLMIMQRFSAMEGQCRKRDKDQADLNEGVRNSQADRDKAIVGKAIILDGLP